MFFGGGFRLSGGARAGPHGPIGFGWLDRDEWRGIGALLIGGIQKPSCLTKNTMAVSTIEFEQRWNVSAVFEASTPTAPARSSRCMGGS